MFFSLPVLVHQGFGVLGEYFFLIRPLFTIPFLTIDSISIFPYLNTFSLKESIFFNLQSNKIFLVFIFSSLLTSILLFLTAFFSLNQLPDSEKSSDYECGFEPFDHATRQPFSVDFFLIALIFLIFDLEIILFIPFILEIDELPLHAFYTFSIVFIILLFSFCYE
jgi:NADH:ubiquinone oxidoreductase subunit 3 (subunit A)